LAKRNKNQGAEANPANNTRTEFGEELNLSKKARKKAARENKK
jgi:hypothetical protein